MSLTDAKLRALKKRERPFKVSDGEGLSILVTPSGSRLWRLAYRYGGKHKLLAFGAYPSVSLRDARKLREAAKEALDDDRDPSHEKKIEKRRQRIATADTFEAIANEWFNKRKSGWAASYAVRLRSRLDEDLMPAIGSRPLASIEPIEILDALRKVEKRDAPEMARRIMQMASAIFRYGVATARCPRDPTADLRGALVVRKAIKSRSALSPEELPEFLDRLDGYEGDATTKMALRLVLLTFVRTSEIRFARWDEFEGLSGREPVWRIPAERMKMRRAHLVPLAPQAVRALAELRKKLLSLAIVVSCRHAVRRHVRKHHDFCPVSDGIPWSSHRSWLQIDGVDDPQRTSIQS